MEIASLQDCLDQKYIRVRKYIRFAIISAKKGTEKLYSKGFDASYKWRVGKLSGNEVMEELFYFVDNARLSQKVENSSTETILEFAILIENYNRISNGRDPKTFTREEWLTVRDMYEKQSKKEREQIYDATLNVGKTPETTSDEEFEIITDDVENVLEDIYHSKWTIFTNKIQDSIFNYRIGIANFSLPVEDRDKLLYKATGALSVFFSENYGKNKFEMKCDEDKFFIEGYFFFEKEC